MRLAIFLIIIFVPLAAAELWSLEFGAPLALTVSVMVLWISGIIPLPVTAILVPCLAIFYGILSPGEAFSSFGNGILGLFLGTFLIVRGIQKVGLDRRIARRFLMLKIASRSPVHLIIVFSLLAWLLAMWMSNTATCAVLLPVCIGIIESFGATLSEDDKERFNARLLLSAAFIPSTGGMATPVGSVPNAIAVHYLGQMGTPIGFWDWLVFALPVSFLLLCSCVILLHLLFPVRSLGLNDKEHHLAEETPPLTREHFFLMFTALGVISLWILPEFLPALEPYLPLAVPPLLFACILFLWPSKPVLEAADLKEIQWGTIILFGGGLCLGNVLDQSGLTTRLAESLGKISSTGSTELYFYIAAISALLSEIGSNTTTASILVPIIGGFAQFMEEGVVIVLGTVLACGLGFMLPISTPPNALVFGTGRVRLRDMILAGVLMDVAGITIIASYMSLLS